MVSLVVPGISVTIALSSSIKAFKSVDFPTFGAPTIATRAPSVRTDALLCVFTSFSISKIVLIIFFSAWAITFLLLSVTLYFMFLKNER